MLIKNNTKRYVLERVVSSYWGTSDLIKATIPLPDMV